MKRVYAYRCIVCKRGTNKLIDGKCPSCDRKAAEDVYRKMAPETL
jgi:hypothetical protein